VTTTGLLEQWREATRAADLAERLARLALESADLADEEAMASEEIATLAEAAAESAARAATTARAAAERAKTLADAKHGRTLREADQAVTDAVATETQAAQGRYHEAEEDARRR